MRIARLSLLAFGPFTNGELGFSPKPGVLDMIYGPNEAGKSTTLRALTALLYGIPARTSDGHVHELHRMRVGASLVDEQGRSLSLVRRKGTKHTLLDAHDVQLPESALGELLGGLDETMFRQMFGLDHERLREGAEALLAGGGQLGASLFDAGTGARAIRDVLLGLKQEADDLFKPRGTTTKLQVAVRTLRDRQRARKEAALSPQVFVEQRRALSEAKAALEQGLETRRALLRESSRLSRALHALPLFSQHDLLLSEQRSLGEVRGVVPSEDDLSLEASLEHAERERARLSDDRERLEKVLAALPPARQAALSLERLRALEQRYGTYRKNLGELPQKRAELRALEGDVRALRERLGPAAGAEGKLDVPARARLRTASDALQHAERSLRELSRASERAARDHEMRGAELMSLGEAIDPSVLSALLRRIEADERLMSLPRREAELAQRHEACTRGLATLGVSLTLEALGQVALPDGAELERIERALSSVEERLARNAARLSELAAEGERLAQERRSLLAEGDVVTEDTLAAARRERGAVFGRLVEELRAGEDGSLGAFREAERHADALADRLRREASRASTLRRIEHDEHANQEARQREREAERTLAEERGALATAARTLLAPLGLGDEPLVRARTKLKRLEVLAERAHEAALLEKEIALARTAASEARGLLDRALGTAHVSLLDALASAHAVSERAEAQRTRRESVKARLRDAELAVRELAAQTRDAEREHTEAQRRFAGELTALGFVATLSPPEVLASLDELAALSDKDRAREAASHALTALEEDSGAFVDELTALLREHLPDAGTPSADDAMARLARAHQASHDQARERERAEAAQERVKAELASHETNLRGLIERRDRLFASAFVEDFAALRALGERERRAAELDTQLTQLELQLLAAGEGRSLDELRAEAQNLDPDEARARLGTLESELAQLHEDIDQRNQDIGRISGGLEQLSAGTGAVGLAEEAEADLADVRAIARRYAELRLGHVLLSREVERYRKSHQGPVLERASRLFPQLTLGRYRGLEVELDERDQPLLVAVRDNGKTVRVEGLSDGTRDQLYLALRVASIERYMANNAPMPLVLDDAFVHFDDARAQAALSVLGELCQRTQVLFFTHHARMIELGKKALGKDKVLVHELDPARGVVRTRDDGPLFARV